MKFYEFTYLVSPELTEQELKETTEKVEALIQENEGNLAKVEKPVKTRLGTPIKNKESAFLCSLNFYIDAQKLAALGQKLSASKSILRFMLSSKKPIKTPAKADTAFPRRRRIVQKEKKVDLKEIEKKLGELLGE